MEEDYDKLSHMGEQQARKLGEYWVRHRLGFDRVYHGPAKRHIRTMEIAGEVVRRARLPWPEPEAVTALDEFDAFTVMKRMVPVLVEEDALVRDLNARFHSERHSPEAGRILQKLFEEVARHWSSGRLDTAEVESYTQFRQRIAEAIAHIRAASAPSTQAVAFTSAGPIAATMAVALDLPSRTAIEYVWLSRNSSYSQFLYTGERFTMHSFNSIPHLDDLNFLTYR